MAGFVVVLAVVSVVVTLLFRQTENTLRVEYRKLVQSSVEGAGDHWIGTEPYGEYFKEVGLDAVVGSVGKVLSYQDAERLLKNNDIILPEKRRYYIETIESHYRHSHENKPLDIMTNVIKDKYPEYEDAYNKVMKRTWAHMFNMFIMKREPLNEYCKWMFDVLKNVEKQIDISTYSTYEQRVYGFLSEPLLDVWLERHPEYKTTEVDYVFMEHTNWLVKGGNFLKRKIVGHY